MSSGASGPPRVFISYSWDSVEHADDVRALADQLRLQGIACALDQYDEAPPEGLTLWMTQHIRDDDFVLMICTPTYRRRVMGEEKLGLGLGARYEGFLIRTSFYHDSSLNTKFVPVLLKPGDKTSIPDPFRDNTYYDVSTSEGYEKLYRRLTRQPAIKPPELGALIELRPKEPGQWPAGKPLDLRITSFDDPPQPVTRAEFAQMEDELKGHVDSRFSELWTYLDAVYPRARLNQTTPIPSRDPALRATFIVLAAKARLQNLRLELSPLGGDEWELTNRHQSDAGIVMSISFYLHASRKVEGDYVVDPDRGVVNFALPPGRDRTVRQVLDFYSVLRAMSDGADFLVQNDAAGTIAFSGYGRLDTSINSFEKELIDALQTIQDAYPSEHFVYPDAITREDAEHIFRVATIIHTGIDVPTLNEAAMELKVEVLAKLLAMLPPDGIMRTLRVTQNGITELLGATLDLGEDDSRFCPVRFEDDVELLRSKVRGLAATDILRVVLLPADAGNRRVVHRYARFSPPIENV